MSPFLDRYVFYSIFAGLPAGWFNKLQNKNNQELEKQIDL